MDNDAPTVASTVTYCGYCTCRTISPPCACKCHAGNVDYLNAERVYYRVDDVYMDDRTVVEISEYPVVRETRCGVVIGLGAGQEKWVRYGGRKRWAYPTREQAIDSFRARKRRLIEICKWRIECAEELLAASSDPEEARRG